MISFSLELSLILVNLGCGSLICLERSKDYHHLLAMIAIPAGSLDLAETRPVLADVACLSDEFRTLW